MTAPVLAVLFIKRQFEKKRKFPEFPADIVIANTPPSYFKFSINCELVTVKLIPSIISIVPKYPDDVE